MSTCVPEEPSFLSATVADIPVVRGIAVATWPIAYADILGPEQLRYMLELMYSEEALHEQMISLGHHFLIARIGGEAVGFASHSIVKGAPARARLHKLYVLPGQQGNGIGRGLLAAVVQAAETLGAAHLELNVNRFNTALQFYRRAGFHVVRDEVIDIGRGYVMDDHVLELDLTTH